MDEFMFTRLDPLQPPLDVFTRMVEQVAAEGKVFAITDDEGKAIAIVIDPDSLAELRDAYVMEELRRGV